MKITKSMYLLAKKIVKEYENDNINKQNSLSLEKPIKDRKREFANSLTSYLEEYGNEMIKEFYEYWTEHGANDRKMRFEKQKSFNTSLRLKRWKKNQDKFSHVDKKGKAESILDANAEAKRILGL